jgi:hypothetical protein
MRVIYADAARLPDLVSRPYDQLGRLDGGAWIAVADDTGLALAEHGPPLFLYFDRKAYETAVSGLTEGELREVIRRRRDTWAPQAQGYVISWLFDLERAGLEAAFQGAPDAVEASLSLLQRLAGLDRYRMEPPAAMAVEILEGEAQLIACLQSALNAGVLKTGLEQRKEWALAMSHVAAKLGATQFENALPFADPERGVFVHPAQNMNGAEEAIRWRDGLVFVVPERHLAELRSHGRSAEILYAEAADFYDSAEMLTTAQLHRDFTARSRRSPSDAACDFVGQIDRLHLYQILMKRELRARTGIDTSPREEVEALGASLSHTHTFSKLAGLSPAEARLATRTDATFFAAIAARHWHSIAKTLEEIRTTVTEH